jgi:hypothetical protein
MTGGPMRIVENDLRTKRRMARAAALVATTVALLAVMGDAQACSVCFGDPTSPMTKSMIAGIWVLLAFIGTLLAGFAGLFGYWIYRSYHPELYREEGATN